MSGWVVPIILSFIATAIIIGMGNIAQDSIAGFIIVMFFITFPIKLLYDRDIQNREKKAKSRENNKKK
mgnify:CR=1 FL=1